MPETSNIVPFRDGKLQQQLQRNFRRRKTGQITALDIDGPTLRITQAEARGEQAVVSRVLTAPLEISTEDRPDPEMLGKAVRKALEAARVKPGAVVMGVPRAQVILRTLSLPASDNLGELASMVHLQIGKDLPFRKDDAVIDFRVRPQAQVAPPPAVESASPDQPSPVPKLEVLVAVAQLEVVNFYKGVASAAGVKLTGLGLHSYANARCVQACGIAQGREPVARRAHRRAFFGLRSGCTARTWAAVVATSRLNWPFFIVPASALSSATSALVRSRAAASSHAMIPPPEPASDILWRSPGDRTATMG